MSAKIRRQISNALKSEVVKLQESAPDKGYLGITLQNFKGCFAKWLGICLNQVKEYDLRNGFLINNCAWKRITYCRLADIGSDHGDLGNGMQVFHGM